MWDRGRLNLDLKVNNQKIRKSPFVGLAQNKHFVDPVYVTSLVGYVTCILSNYFP